VLLNPLLIYFGSAWGQFDSIVAFLSLLSLVFLHSGMLKRSAILLALAIALKPIALPILPVAIVFLMGKSLRQTINYSVLFITGEFLFCIVPFIILNGIPLRSFRDGMPNYRCRRDVVFDIL